MGDAFAGPRRCRALSFGLASLARLASLALIAACTQDTSVRTSIVPLASGEFHGLSWGGSQEDRFYVVARPGPPDSDNPTQSAVLVSPNHKQPCSLGDDIASWSLQTPRTSLKYVTGAPSPARVTLLRAVQDKIGTLSFSDTSCERSDFEVANVGSSYPHWNVYAPDLLSMKFAVAQADGTLLFADPWTEEQHEVTHGVQAGYTFDGGLAFVEDGQMVQRDNDGRERTRRGNHISWYYALGGLGDYAYVDDDGVFVVRGDKVKQIGPPGSCGPLNLLDQFLPGSFAFYSPCETQHLTVVSESTGKTYDYEDGVDSDYDASGGLLLFKTHTDTTSKLWQSTVTQPDQHALIAERDTFGLRRVFWWHPGVVVLQVRLADGTISLWSLAMGDPSHTLTTITEGITNMQPADFANFAQYTNGDLVMYDADLSHELLRIANASAANFVFNGKATALAYLTNVDASTQLGRLELHLINGDHFILDDDVREFREVWWPERGLLYATGGDGAGINFARVDIPCETTSDTAWACGF